jgi:hypothetical protein
LGDFQSVMLGRQRQRNAFHKPSHVWIERFSPLSVSSAY